MFCLSVVTTPFFLQQRINSVIALSNNEKNLGSAMYEHETLF